MADSKSVVRCPNGHFFDEKKYDRCPLCEKGAPPNEKKGGVVIPTGGITYPEVTPDKEHRKTQKDPKKTLAERVKKEPSTVSIWNHWGRKKGEETEEKSAQEESGKEISQIDVFEEEHKDDTEKKPVHEEVQKEHMEEEDADTRNLKDVVEAAGVDKSDIKTISVFGSVSKVVVGWLIAIDGLEIGHEFKIVDGKNLIGRDPNMNISIQKDNSISRDTHTVILYDAEGLNFYVLPEGKGTVYVNKEIVLAPTKLNKGDRIKIGNTLLYFLPLCGEDFDWKDYFNS